MIKRLVSYFSFICLFTIADVIVFPYITGTGSTEALTYYRIGQFAWMALLLWGVWKLGGWWVVLACVIQWWLLFDDVLYYWIKGIPLQDFDWWGLSPVVFVSIHILGQKVAHATAVLNSGLIGVGVGFCMTVLGARREHE